MKFVTYRDRTGEYRWRLVARNGRTIADGGEGYKRRFDRDQAIRNIRVGASSAKVVDR